MPDFPLQDQASGVSLLVALALLWWRMGQAEKALEKLTDRLNEFIGG